MVKITKEYIEDQILLYSNSSEKKDIAHCQVYLELRKKLLDELFVNHIDEYITELANFNERLTSALQSLWNDAHQCFDKINSEQGFDIELQAFLELDKNEAEGDETWNEIFNSLSDPAYNPQYMTGVCLSPIILKTGKEPIWKSFDEFIGNDGKSWNEGLPNELTKNIPLTMMFHHVYDHTYWSLYDLLKIKHFNIVINTTHEKVK